MAEDNSHVWESNDLSPEDNILPELQDKSEVPFEIVGTGNDEDYCQLTPEKELLSQKDGSIDHNSETYLSSGGISSDLSTKEGSETMSSSSSSSDAESGTYKLPTKKYFLREINGDEGLQPKTPESEDGIFGNKEMNNLVNEDLLVKVANNEVELKFTKEKLESSREEIARLKYENLTLVEELGRTIEKLRTSEDDKERMENQLQDQLDLANQSIDLLQAELGSERKLVSELQHMIIKTSTDLTDYGREIDELKLALHDAQEDFFKDKSQFQSDITHLHEEKDSILTKTKLLEEKIQQFEVQETGFLNEIKQLKAELFQRCELVDSLNKSIDTSKLEYDMLMAEKDELGAELRCRDTDIQQMEERVRRLSMEHAELLAESEKSQKVVEELRVKVKDQEKEMEKQTRVISDRAEEKREAIRQLCFSLEHYRNGYHELRQAFIKHNRSTVMAS